MTVKKEDLAVAGRAIYAQLREELEASENGNFVVIDPGSGDYEIDANPTVARRRLEERHPGLESYTRRIGQRDQYRMVGIRLSHPTND